MFLFLMGALFFVVIERVELTGNFDDLIAKDNTLCGGSNWVLPRGQNEFISNFYLFIKLRNASWVCTMQWQ